MTSPSRRRPRLVLALLLPFLAAALQSLVWERIPYVAFFLFFPAVFFSSWLGGRVGGMVASLLSVGLVKWLFMAPGHTLVPESAMQGMVMAVFAGVGFLIAQVHHRLEARTSQLVAAQTRTEAVLRQVEQSEAWFRTLFEQSPLGTAVVNSLTGRIYEANQRFADIAGRSREELTAIDWMLITHPDDVPEQLANMARLHAGEINGFQMNKRLIRPDGSTVWVSLTVAPVTVGVAENPRHLATLEDITERQQAETRLRESEQRFRELFEYLPLAYQSLDSQGRYIDANQKLADLLGYDTPAELLGQRFGEFWDAAIRNDFDRRFAEFKAKQGTVAELTLRRRDGKPVTVLLAGRVQSDGEGRFLRTHCILLDITERHEMEEEIRRLNADLERKVAERTAELAAAQTRVVKALAGLTQSEALFRTVFEQAPLGVALTDSLTGRIYKVNDRFAAIAGRTPEDLLTSDWMRITHPEDIARKLDNLARLSAGDIPGFQMNCRWLRPDGAVVWISLTCTPVTVASEQTPRHLAIVEDITERVQTEEKLRLSEERHRLLADNAIDVIWTMDFDGHFTYVSPSVEKLRGFTPEEVMRQSMAEAPCPESCAIVLEAFGKMMANRQAGLPIEDFRGELEQPCKDGSTVWTEVSTCAIVDSHGQYVEILGVTRDISERKRYERELRQARDAAEAAARAKGEWEHSQKVGLSSRWQNGEKG